MNILNRILIFTLCLILPALASAEPIEVIVNENNPMTEIRADQVAEFFLKKQRQWSDGTLVRFFDHDDDSEERKYFLRSYLRQTPREIELFWIGQKLYTGYSAPTQVSSNAIMVSLVARFPGAIGYVSQGFPLRKGVKIIPVKDE